MTNPLLFNTNQDHCTKMKTKLTTFLLISCIHFAASGQQPNPEMVEKFLDRYPAV